MPCPLFAICPIFGGQLPAAELGEARLFMVEAGCRCLGLRQHPRLILRHCAAITLALTISGGK